MPEAAIRLTQGQIDFFRHNGYLAIPAITTSDEIERMKEIDDRLFTIR